MKKLTLTILSLLVAGLGFSDEKKRKPLVIGKIVPGKSVVDPGEKRPVGDVKKPQKPRSRPFPLHWGKPPAVQTKDIRPLPAGFGMGSSTLAKWIGDNIKRDLEKKERPKRPEPIQEIKEKLAVVKLVQNDLSLARKALRDDLKGKSKEDVAELVKKFRDSQKEKFQQLKVAQKALREEVRSRIQTGDRRESE